MMKVAVVGCGAIGGICLGLLTEKNIDVTGVVKSYQKESIIKDGLLVNKDGVIKKYQVKIDTKVQKGVDLAILATKIDDLESVVKENLKYLEHALLLTTQNGVAADYILSKYFPKEYIITGIVMFGATYYPPNLILHNFDGELVVGSVFNTQIKNFDKAKLLLQEVFKTSFIENIIGAKYLKIFVNLNNCLPAVLGVSMQEAFSDHDICRLAIELNKEAYTVVERSGIKLQSLPSYPKERLEKLVCTGTEEASTLFSKIMTSLSSKPLYGSILQSIKRGRKSEIDYINGEIVNLAKKNGLSAPLNGKIIKAVHKVESTGRFYTKEELLKEVNYV